MSRAGRRDQFVNRRAAGAYGTFSHALIRSAETCLREALQERRRNCYRLADNHAADNAVGAISLILAALDVWMNECFDTLAALGDSEARQIAADLDKTPRRFAELASRVGATIPDALLRDLTLATEARHDIIHHLPRPIGDPGGVPSWLYELQERRLFFTDPQEIKLEDGGTMPCDFNYDDKLASYKLAFWTFRTVEQAVDTIAAGANDRVQSMIAVTAINFTSYRLTSICPPEELRAFDQAHGLELTRSQSA